MIPSLWAFALLALATFRVWKLIGDDVILDGPRNWFLERVGGEASDRGVYWSAFLFCPWCAGTYIGLAWWGAWQVWPHGTLVAAGLVAMLGAVGLLGTIWSAIAD